MDKKKVIWVSSYLPRSCGIAYYSENYLKALINFMKKKKRKFVFKIISHTDAKKADFPIIDLKDKEWHKKVFKKIKKEKANIVHFQHEYGLYETYGDNNKRVIELLKLLKEEGISTVMTYHSVLKKIEYNFLKFMSDSLKLLDAGIVHEMYQKNVLKSDIKWKPQNIYVLPHGSEENINIKKDEARKGFGYKKKELIVGSVGIADKRKGFRTLIKQWPKVIKKFPTAKLSIEVKPHADKTTREYIEKVMKIIMKSPVSSSIEYNVEDYNKNKFYRRLKSFDVLVLPYKEESQSGVLAHGFSTGTPAIVTDIEGLGAEIRNSGAGIAVKNRKKFYKAIIKMLSSKRLRDMYSKNALNYVKKVNGWDIIAKKTFKIYDEIDN